MLCAWLKANAIDSLISRGLFQTQHDRSTITLGLHTAEAALSPIPDESTRSRELVSTILIYLRAANVFEIADFSFQLVAVL